MNLDLSAEEAKSLFEYRDGHLIRRKAAGTAKAGRRADCINCDGYFIVKVQQRKHMVHRIIWIIHHGYSPIMVDHIDGNKQNNKIENLREVDNTKNHWNEKKRSDNKSGYKGVWWHKQSSKWEAGCKVHGKQITVGKFERIEDAVEAVRKFREQHHGEYANHG